MSISADAERWEIAIRREYSAREKLYPDTALGWRLLYGPRSTLATARVAFIGLNPGGRTINPTHGEFSCEAGSAYRKDIEDWGRSSGLQDQVLALLARLVLSPEEVLAGNLAPFRSPSESSLMGATEAISFGTNLWRDIFAKVRPQLVISMGGTANRVIAGLLSANAIETHPIGWGSFTASRGTFADGTWIGLPHLSRFAIMKRTASQTALNDLFASLD